MESEPTTNSADFDPVFPDLRDFSGDEVFFRVFYRNVASLHLRPSVVKYGLLSNNRRSKLHAVIDYLFFFHLIVCMGVASTKEVPLLEVTPLCWKTCS